MATNDKDMEGKIPTWLKFIPGLASLSYFAYSYFYRKQDMFNSVMISGIIGIGAALPIIGGAYMGRSAAAIDAPPVPGTGPSDSPSRQDAIDYLVKTDINNDQGKNFIKAPPTEAARKAAYNTLTNDELTSMYLLYKARNVYGNDVTVTEATDNDRLKNFALANKINIYGITNVTQQIQNAMAKIVKSLNG